MSDVKIQDRLQLQQPQFGKRPERPLFGAPRLNIADSLKLSGERPIPTELQKLAELSQKSGIKPTFFSKSQVIIQQGTASDNYIYILIRGSAVVTITGKPGKDGAIPSITPRDGLMGEISALYGIETTGTVQVRSGSEVLVIPRDQFRAMLKGNPELERFVTAKLEARLNYDGTRFFRSESDSANLYADGPSTLNAERPKPEYLITAEEIKDAYKRGGTKGLAELMTRHVIKLAKNGDSTPLRHWMRVSRGQGSFNDSLYILNMFPTGQTHIHPTRSLPVAFIALLGISKLGLGDEYWAGVDKKVKDIIRKPMQEAGYRTIRDLYQALAKGDPKALETLRMMVEYHPPEGKGNLNDYLNMNSFTSSFYTELRDIKAAARAVAENEYSHGVRMIELRFGPDQGTHDPVDVIRAQIDGLRDAERLHPGKEGKPGLKARAIVSFFTTMNAADIERYTRAIETVKRTPGYGEYLVGVDICGPEVSRVGNASGQMPNPESLGRRIEQNGRIEYEGDIGKFAPALRRLQNLSNLKTHALQITIHAGENFISLEQGMSRIKMAIEAGAIRIGHGTAVGINIREFVRQNPIDGFGQAYDQPRIQRLIAEQDGLLKLMAERGIVVEVCIDSNVQTNPIEVKDHPFKKFLEYGVRIAISNDNATTSHTSGPKQILDAARAMKLPLGRVLYDLILSSLHYEMGALNPVVHDAHTPQTFERKIPANLKDRMGGMAVSTAVAYMGVDGTVIGVDAYLAGKINKKVELPAVSAEPRLFKASDLKGELKALCNGRAYLLLIPVKNRDNVEGYISIATDDPRIGTDQKVKDAAARIATDRLLSSFTYRSTADHSGARNMAAYYNDTGVILRGPAPRFAEIVLNFSMHDINARYQHKGGDDLVAHIYQKIKEFAAKNNLDIMVYRDGANFIIRLNGNPGTDQTTRVMRGLISNFNQRQSAKLNDQNHTFENGIRINLAANHYDEALHNPGAAEGKAPKLTVTNARMWLNQTIGRVNEGKGHMEITIVDSRAAADLNIENRLEKPVRRERAVDSWKPEWEFLMNKVREELSKQGIEIPDTKEGKLELERRTRELYVEPDSGLLNRNAFDLLAQEMVARARASGGKVSLALLDGNKFSEFIKTYGQLGRQMVDIIMQTRIVEMAGEIFGKRGILFTRDGTGSEELRVIGQVDEATMRAALEEFHTRLAESLKIKCTVREMQETPLGRRYLQENDIDTSNPEKKIWVDLVKLQRGPNGEFRGISFTGILADLARFVNLPVEEAAARMDVELNTAKDKRNLKRGPMIELSKGGVAKPIAQRGAALMRDVANLWGPRVASLLSEKVSADKMGGMSKQGFKQLMHDLRSASHGKNTLARYGFNGEELSTMQQAMKDAKAGYIKRKADQLVEVRGALAEDKPIADMARKKIKIFLETLQKQPELRGKLGVELAEVEAMLKQLGAKAPAAAGSSPTEVPAGLVDLARAMGVKPREILRLNAKGELEKAFQRVASKMTSEKLAAWMRGEEGVKFLSDPKNRATFNELLGKLAEVEALRRAGRQVTEQHVKGIIVGLVTLFGAEKLANIFGINDPVGRFVFVLGLSHVANTTALRMFQDQGMQKLYTKFVNSTKFVFNGDYAFSNRLKVAARPFVNFSVNTIKGLSQMAAISNVLKKLGIENEYAVMIGAFVIPSGWKTAAETIAVRTANRAVNTVLWKGLRLAGKGLAEVSFVTFGFDTLHSLLKDGYEKSVEARLEDRLKNRKLVFKDSFQNRFGDELGEKIWSALIEAGYINKNGVILKAFTSDFDRFINNLKMHLDTPLKTTEEQQIFDLMQEGSQSKIKWYSGLFSQIFMPETYRSDIANGNLVEGGRAEAKRAIYEIWKEDELLSGRIKSDLSMMLAAMLRVDGGEKIVYDLIHPVEWGDYAVNKTVKVGQIHGEPQYRDEAVQISGKKIYEFARRAMARQRSGSFDDKKIVEMVKAEFKISDEQYNALVPKFFKASIQEQFATLYALEPFHGSTNSEIRRMFNKDGTLRIGSYYEFLGWIKQKANLAVEAPVS